MNKYNILMTIVIEACHHYQETHFTFLTMIFRRRCRYFVILVSVLEIQYGGLHRKRRTLKTTLFIFYLTALFELLTFTNLIRDGRF